MERLAGDKHSGSLQKFVTSRQKKFFNIGPRMRKEGSCYLIIYSFENILFIHSVTLHLPLTLGRKVVSAKKSTVWSEQFL